jgi:uncharacterized Zn finger protein
MTCQNCYSNDLELTQKYISYDPQEEKEFLVEVYECQQCGKVRPIKTIS